MQNVSQITQCVRKIIWDNSDLENVWMCGKISNVKSTKNGTLNFILTDKGDQIECVIFHDKTPLPPQKIPVDGSNVFVKGEIYVYETKSEYRFMVTDIRVPEVPFSTPCVSVRTLTNSLKDTLSVHSVKVQGEISEVFGTRMNYTILKLKDITTDGQSDDIIECVIPPGINPSFPLQIGERVQVIGKFGTFSRTSVYRIEIDDANNIIHVKDQPTQHPTTTNQCERCGQPCEPPFQLCPTDHYAELDNEGIVVGAVLRYFNAPRFENFSTKREQPITWGANKEGRADIALLNSQGNPVAIAECKKFGYDGNDGIVQLEGYIAPTVANLGLFANNTDPFEWTFLKRNDERNRYDQISRSQFEKELGIESTPPLPSDKTRIELIHGNIIDAKVDAIVNAANSQLTRGSGVDGAIRDAGGEDIIRECHEIVGHRGVPQGRAVITTGGELPARHVIHAVGPIWDGGEQHEAETLIRCYKNSLQLAVENGIRSIAFPAISTGNYGFPVEQATPIALKTVKEFVEHAHMNKEIVPECIQFVLFNEEAYNCYVKELTNLGLDISCLIG